MYEMYGSIGTTIRAMNWAEARKVFEGILPGPQAIWCRRCRCQQLGQLGAEAQSWYWLDSTAVEAAWEPRMG